MNIEKIKNILKNKDVLPINETNLFSVLIPLIEINGKINLMYEVRSKSIRQPGEISFPGGRIEHKETPREAALRETYEETGIEIQNIEIIKELNFILNKVGSFIYSFLGYIKNIDYKNIEFNKAEVEEIFYVPIDFFIENEPEIYYMNYYPKFDEKFPHHMVNDGINYNWDHINHPVYFYRYKDKIIWGLTAQITYGFIKKLNN